MLLPDPLFIALAGTAIASPGPGVVLTLSNALRHGFWPALGGILGLTCASVVLAALSATGLGLLLAASPTAFTLIKYLGAAYLVYLARRLWQAPPLAPCAAGDAGFGHRFREALLMQFGNPQALLFCIALFPRFMEGAQAPLARFAVLVASYGLLIVLIHSGYAFAARSAQHHLEGERARLVNHVAAVALVGFALATLR